MKSIPAPNDSHKLPGIVVCIGFGLIWFKFEKNARVLTFSRENISRGIMPTEFSESAPLTLNGGLALSPGGKINWTLSFTVNLYKIR